jgi:hypothetical protein
LTYLANVNTKAKTTNAIAVHTKLTAFGIGLAITLAIGTAIEMLDHQHLAHANRANGGNGGSSEQDQVMVEAGAVAFAE